MKRVLVVEDEKDLCELIASEIESHSTESLLAFDGETALEILSSNSVDLVITDIRMPGMDGIDLMQKIKERFGDKVTILAMTGFSDKNPAEIISAGAKELYKKPYDLNKLFEDVEKLLGSKEEAS